MFNKSKVEFLGTQLFVLASFCFIAWILNQIGSDMLHVTIPFDTDEADHANAALELYTALMRLHPVQIFQAIARQGFYPPLYSIFVAISYLFFGANLIASRIPSMIFFAFYIGLLLVASKMFFLRVGAKEQTKFLAMICASLTGIFAVTSPISIYNAVLCMLEIPGMFFIALCIYYFILFQDNQSNKSVIKICLAGLAVFFAKYNFGIITIPALGLTFFLAPQVEKDIYKRIQKCLLPGLFIAISIIFWVLITDYHSFIHFFIGHKSYDPLLSSTNLFFEINAWINSYCLNLPIAVLLLFLAPVGAIEYWNHAAARFCALNTFFAFFVLALSTTNEERHFMVALPTITFLATAGMFFILQKISLKNQIAPLFTAFILITLIIGVTVSKLQEIKNNIFKRYEGEPTFLELYDFIAANTQANVPIIVNGVSDDFGIETLRWMTAKTGKLAYTEVTVDSYPFREDKNFTARKRKRNLDTPYKDKSFPQKPLSKILARSFYKYAIFIKKLDQESNKRKKEGAEFNAAMQNYPSQTLSLGTRAVTIYKLQ